MSKVYYGFRVKGETTKFLEQFKDFEWLDEKKDVGFLGNEVKQNSTEFHEKQFLKRLLENYLIVTQIKKEPNPGLERTLLSYLENEKEPIILIKQNNNTFFKNWDEYQNFKISFDDFWIGNVKIGIIGQK